MDGTPLDSYEESIAAIGFVTTIIDNPCFAISGNIINRDNKKSGYIVVAVVVDTAAESPLLMSPARKLTGNVAMPSDGT